MMATITSSMSVLTRCLSEKFVRPNCRYSPL